MAYVSSSSFPPGTPVWYNFRDISKETEQQTTIKAYEGVIRSISNCKMTGSRTYEILRCNSVLKNSNGEVYVEMVEESNIAYGCKCPVHVKLIDNSSTHTETDGEIISPHFNVSNVGAIEVTYTVRLLINDGSFVIEQNVTSDRVQYKFGLDSLRSKLRFDPSSNKMVGIRTSPLGLPSIKSKAQKIRLSVKPKPVFIHLVPTRNAVKPSQLTCAPSSSQIIGSASTSITFPKTATERCNEMCKRNNCSRHAQNGCEGHCYAHFYLLLRNGTKQPNQENNSDVQKYSQH